MNNLKKNRLDKLNQALMEQRVPSSMRRARKRRAAKGKPEPTPAAEEDSGLVGTAVDATLTGAPIINMYFQGKTSKANRKLIKSIIETAGKSSKVSTKGANAALKAAEAGNEAGALKRMTSWLKSMPGDYARRFMTDFAQAALRSPVLRPMATRIATSLGMEVAAIEGGLALSGAGTVGTASAGSIAAAILGGAAVGTAIGYGLNKAFGAADLEGEIAERISKARKSLDYAIAELYIYCQGRGPLCGDEVKCSGKPGGYVYDIAGEEGMYGLGRGAGRELFGLPGFRKFKQTPNAFHAYDGAVMIGLAAAIAAHDLKNGKIVLPTTAGGKATVKAGAASKKFEACIKKWLNQSNVMLAQAKRLGMNDAYESLRLVYGVDAFPSDLPDKKPGASPVDGNKKCVTMPISKGCKGRAIGNMIHILTQGTAEGMKAEKADSATAKKLMSREVLDDETITFVDKIMQAENPAVAKAWKSQNYSINTGDPVSKFFDKVSSEAGGLMKETNSLNENFDFYSRIKKQKNMTLQKKLMERL